MAAAQPPALHTSLDASDDLTPWGPGCLISESIARKVFDEKATGAGAVATGEVRAIDRKKRHASRMDRISSRDRAEKKLGEPVMITSRRDGWLGSSLVGRIIPRDANTSPWLYFAFGSSLVQQKMKTTPSGSLADSTVEEDARAIRLPPITSKFNNDRDCMGCF
jgi:hypothetical protein